MSGHGDMWGNPAVVKVWDVATGECVATLESESVRRAASAFCTTFVIWVFVVGQQRCRVSGRVARRFCVGRQDAQGVGHGDWSMRGDAARALEFRAARGVRFLYNFCDLSSL